MKRICLNCKKEFRIYPYEAKSDRRKYCSKQCFNPATIINCKTCNISFRISPSRIKAQRKYCSKKCADKDRLGKPGYWIGKKRPNLVTSTSFKEGSTPWNKGKLWERMKGENNPQWVGGAIKHPDKRIRNSIDYVLWRKEVFERDNYTCQDCHVRGGNLQADHIKPFALYPELRLDVNNGRTLCIDCHKKTETYGKNRAALAAWGSFQLEVLGRLITEN